MSVIANLVVLPNRLGFLLRYLSRQRMGIERDDVSVLFSPRSIARGKTTIFDAVLTEAMRLGLVAEEPVESKAPRLRSTVDPRFLDDDGLRTLFGERLLLGEFDVGPFREALAWFLMQNPLEPFVWDRNMRLRVTADLGDECEALELTNKARFQNFAYWARWLGFAAKLGISSKDVAEEIVEEDEDGSEADLDATNATAFVVPDPTEAIARKLPQIFRAAYELSVDELLAAWASVLPVLEGGTVREAVERRARPELARRPKTLSKATSLALRRLEIRGRLSLRAPSDAEMHLLDLGDEMRPVSHVALVREQGQ